MWRITWLVGGIILGSLLTLGAQRYHVIHTKDGLKMVAKRTSTLTDTYVDVREWGVVEWSKHPDLVWTLTQNDRKDVLGSHTLENDMQGVWQMFDSERK